MKKFNNTFAVTGFIGNDAEIHSFESSAVARFSLAVNRTEKKGDDTVKTSAFINVEAWRKNENSNTFGQLTKGTLVTVEGFLKPEEWQDNDGKKHNRIVFAATKIYEPEELEKKTDKAE